MISVNPPHLSYIILAFFLHPHPVSNPAVPAWDCTEAVCVRDYCRLEENHFDTLSFLGSPTSGQLCNERVGCDSVLHIRFALTIVREKKRRHTVSC